LTPAGRKRSVSVWKVWGFLNPQGLSTGKALDPSLEGLRFSGVEFRGRSITEPLASYGLFTLAVACCLYWARCVQPDPSIPPKHGRRPADERPLAWGFFSAAVDVLSCHAQSQSLWSTLTAPKLSIRPQAGPWIPSYPGPSLVRARISRKAVYGMGPR
jgi:hypothetical protein